MNLFLLLLLGGVLLYWVDTVRARERAQRAADLACRQRGLQLLDQTVERVSLRLRRGPDGWLRFERRYRFDFSLDGMHRSIAEIRLFGQQIESVELSFADMPLQPHPPASAVVPGTVATQSGSPEETKHSLPLGWRVIDGSGGSGSRERE